MKARAEMCELSELSELSLLLFPDEHPSGPRICPETGLRLWVHGFRKKSAR